MEVVRVAGGVEDGMAGGDDCENSLEGETQERKLVCMVGVAVILNPQRCTVGHYILFLLNYLVLIYHYHLSIPDHRASFYWMFLAGFFFFLNNCCTSSMPLPC